MQFTEPTPAGTLQLPYTVSNTHYKPSYILAQLTICSCTLLQGKYFEAVASDIDPEKKSIVACFPADAGMDECCFKMEYDILVLGVGSINNTFGIKGVQEHTFFFKSITDANKLRRQVSECFERAALPNTSDKVMSIQPLSSIDIGYVSMYM